MGGLSLTGAEPSPLPPEVLAAPVGDARERAAQVARRSYGRLLALLASGERDVAAAEDALAEAFEAALRQWPEQGVPMQPEAWLLAVARRRRVDGVRSAVARERLAADLSVWLEQLGEPSVGDSESVPLPERRLELMLACAHPALEPAVRAPLILQTLLGWDAASIASAFLVSPAAMAQRLVRAKAKIREAGIPFRVPPAAEWPERLRAVQDAIYAIYSEAWVDATGADARRRNLGEEALWLAQLLAALCPGEPEVLGLYALLLHTHARQHARRNARGDYVPLSEQDPRQWDGALIAEAEAALRRAAEIGRLGRYQLEAAVQSAHNARRDGSSVDAFALELLYEALLTHAPGLASRINHAVAVGRTRGPEAAWALLEACADQPGAHSYQAFWAAQGDVLAKLGRREAAWTALDRAIGLEADPAVRAELLRRQKALEA